MKTKPDRITPRSTFDGNHGNMTLSHSTSAPTVISYINDNSDDDFTYMSDSEDELQSDNLVRRKKDPGSASQSQGSRSACQSTSHSASYSTSYSTCHSHDDAIRSHEDVVDKSRLKHKVNLVEPVNFKKMLEQELCLSGGSLDQIQAFVVAEDQVKFSRPDSYRETTRGVASKLFDRRWRVLPHHALPKWLQDNDYLLTGHRPQLDSFIACFKSIFRIHTETGNIWTHLLGAIAFISIAIYFIARPEIEIQWQEKVIFSTFFMAAIVCLSCSWLYHTMSCHSPSVSYVFAKLDYCGIAILTMGSFVPWLYYSFYCQFVTKMTYIAVILALGVAAIVVSMWNKFASPKYRPLRAGLFIGLGLSGIIPAIHYSVNMGFVAAFTAGALGWLVLMAVLYISGALLYALRIPERFFPGKCDIWFQSHQLFHVFVVVAAFVHYHGICLMAAHRLAKGDCLLPIPF